VIQVITEDGTAGLNGSHLSQSQSRPHTIHIQLGFETAWDHGICLDLCEKEETGML